jgi:1-deoxy-D-xylulose-5-phosphate reductoisomerase
MQPVISAIRSRKPIALANKECLVVAGELITTLAKEYGVNIYPVDSEHSAIFQCLAGEFHNTVEKVILTASGGPFRGMQPDELSKVSPEQALKHPNWKMGCKISIDSATLMNKGLEVIEAKWLFSLKPEQIEVIIHPQSIVHSLVQFSDGSLKAQLGLPDMKLPIVYALSYPTRLHNSFPRFRFTDYPDLSFEPANTRAFTCLPLAYSALEKGGNMPCVLNAANEIAVAAFLKKKIGFSEIPQLIDQCMNLCTWIPLPDLNMLLSTNEQTRNRAIEMSGLDKS